MNYRRLIFSFLIISIGFFISPPGIAASTFVNLDIEQDTTWTLVGSPYVVQSNVTVFPGVTLSIEPGVVVKFDGTGLGIFGDVVAEGTDMQPIYFTSFYDDEVAGEIDDEEFCFEDVDEEGNSLGEVCEIFDWGDPVAGDWGGFYIENSQNSSFKNVFFRYANTALTANTSNVNFENLDINNSQDGLVAFNNSSITLLDASITCDSEGILIFQNSKLNFSNGFVLCNDYGIYLFDNGEANIYNIKVSGARQVGIMAFRNTNPSGINITKSEITGNDYGFIVFETPISVHESGIHGNTTNGIIAFDPLTPNQFNFANNYWGDSSGPYNESLNPEGLGNEVYGDVLFEPWCESETCKVRNPVIIVPGLLGTEIIKPTAEGPEKLWLDLAHNLTDIGDQFMDALQFKEDLTPSDTSLTLGDVIRKAKLDLNVKEVTIFDYSESLIKEFENQGYVEGIDLFLFPYDWRYGVSEYNTNKLKQKITDVLTISGGDKVDVIAHSMGGLITKKYVKDNPADHHIHKAIFVGVPNTGSPKAIKNLLTGEGNWLTADSEMKKISKNMPAAYDVAPTQEYFKNKGSYIKVVDQKTLSSTSKYLNFNEAVSFLITDHGLNADALINSNHLHTEDFDNYDLRTNGVDLYAINGCKAGTTGTIVELRNHDLFGNFTGFSYLAPEQVPGDGTVPLESATNLPIDSESKFYALKGKHGDMLSSDGIRQKIVNIISGSTLSTEDDEGKDIITQDIAQCELNGKAISIFSPLSIDIIDQDGNHAGFSSDGVSIENNIPNADFQVMGEHKFVYLPTDDGQSYTINVVGTGTGIFTLTDTTIVSNIITGMQVFSNIAVTPSLLGHVNISDNTTLALDTDGDSDIDQNLTPTSVLNAEQVNNFIPYQEDINSTVSEQTNASGSSSRVGENTLQSIIPIVIKTEELVTNFDNISRIVADEIKVDKVQPVKEEDLIQENVLTANVGDTGIPISSKVVVVSISGIFGLWLLAKSFIKL